MIPVFVALSMFQGQTYSDTLTLTDDIGVPLDLTGQNARMQVRDDAGALILELSTLNGKILSLGATGVIKFNVSAAEMAAITTPYDYAQWRYDLELFYDVVGEEIVTRPVKGVVIFWTEVTV